MGLSKSQEEVLARPAHLHDCLDGWLDRDLAGICGGPLHLLYFLVPRAKRISILKLIE